MLKLSLLITTIIWSLISTSQFYFSGEVNRDFYNSKAYLIKVDDYKKNGLILIENIICESNIDSSGKFEFIGNCLTPFNQYYTVYVDNCNDDINNSKHLLNQCDSYISKLFIANNSDSIYFPLNDLNQMLCEAKVSHSNSTNNLNQIDSLQESILANFHLTKNDAQRNNIYKNYFTQLKEFAFQLKNPLIELYAFSLYSDEKSFSRNHYLLDVQHSEYYGDLLARLQSNYPKSPYTAQFKSDLQQVNYFKNDSVSFYKTLTYVFGGLLLLTLFYILNNIRIQKKNTQKADYKEVLTSQELKVFELMNQKLSNKEIADNLFVSVSTIKSHINKIYTKLSINSRSEIETFFN
ncbi:MAG: response regulator transcription factor [Flavobacteriales bacterium]